MIIHIIQDLTILQPQVNLRAFHFGDSFGRSVLFLGKDSILRGSGSGKKYWCH